MKNSKIDLPVMILTLQLVTPYVTRLRKISLDINVTLN